jgi:copper chaperone CopZ
MKQAILSVFISVIAVTGFAQVKAVQTAKIKTPTVVCEKCKDRIETYLKRYDGVMTINVNYHSKETAVKYLSDRINIEEIKTAIANAGYDADDVPANPDSYKALPICCKKPEDGGPAKKH